MKVTYNWLKDFVDIRISPQALADKLTMAGLEVTSLEERDGDFIYEIEITSNRPDWLSVIGIAREVAAITKSRIKIANPRLTGKQEKSKQEKSSFGISIEDKKDCPLYIARIIRELKVGASPAWLAKRLELVGIRSVNNIVDITNYVLFEYGEPLHAFDLDKLKGRAIFVRRANSNEKITTIDGTQRTLNPETLVIADENKAVAIAGIMGGKDTEVTAATKNILLEAAIFNPIIIRRGKQAQGIQSEAAYRFERGIDIEIVEMASLRAAGLMREMSGGQCVFARSVGISKAGKKIINLDTQAANKFLGIKIGPAQIKLIFSRLGFQAKTKKKNNFLVSVPSFRNDLSITVDLIEEIARIYGYDNIPKSLPAVKPSVIVGQARDLVSRLKNLLVGLGLNEVITYSLIDKDLLKPFKMEPEPQVVEIRNPLSKEQEILRPALMPSLAKCIAHNLNQKQAYINIFEIAPVFCGQKEKTEERLTLGLALCGINPLWVSRGRIIDEPGLLHLKGITETLFERMGIKSGGIKFIDKNNSELEIDINEVKIGTLESLAKPVLDNLGIKNKEVFAAEINLDALIPFVRFEKKFIPLPRYPGVLRDISLVLKEEIPAGQVVKVVQEQGGKLLNAVEITDYYKGKQIESGFKGLTVSCLYSSGERTLTEEEINPIHANIIQGLKDKLEAKIR